MLPDFLGLGAQRAGTTWLDQVLRQHPAVYLPERRKEVHFFDQHYSRGPGWYETFFHRADRSGGYARVGEITPRYLFDPLVPPRIHALLPECKMLVALRNPVTRLYSQYGLHVRDLGERRTFPRFVREHKDAFYRGLYSEQLFRYFELFERRQFLILIYEEMVLNMDETVEKLADFLKLDAEPMRIGSQGITVNASYAPVFPQLRKFARSLGAGLRACGADSVVNFAKRVGAPALFGRRPLAPLQQADRSWLEDLYADEIERLEKLLGRSLAAWKDTLDSNASPRRPNNDSPVEIGWT